MIESSQVKQEELKEAVRFQEALTHIRAVLTLPSGVALFKYLLKEFEAGELPPIGLSGDLLMDKLGSLRAGNALYDLISAASPEKAALILGEIKKEKYDQKVHIAKQG